MTPPVAPVPRWQRPLFFVLGACALAVGLVGLVMPLVPGLVFLALAAACFSRSSPRLMRWLLAHPRIGPFLGDWQASGAIPRPLKWFATAAMAASLLFILLSFDGPAVPALVGALMAGALVYLWTRPEGAPS